MPVGDRVDQGILRRELFEIGWRAISLRWMADSYARDAALLRDMDEPDAAESYDWIARGLRLASDRSPDRIS